MNAPNFQFVRIVVRSILLVYLFQYYFIFIFNVFKEITFRQCVYECYVSVYHFKMCLTLFILRKQAGKKK